ncbi:MAG: ATP-binding protein [Ktedonobacteraceae bacterium]
MEVEMLRESVNLSLNMSEIIATLLTDLSAVTDYRILRDSLPKRLAALLNCRCVLLYQRSGETLQFAAGSFDNVPGWSAALLSVAHINPIALTGDELEMQAWRARHAVIGSRVDHVPSAIAVPLIYRQRAIGVMTCFRSDHAPSAAAWCVDDSAALEAVAGVVALLLENARLLERDRERIHELSLLNTIVSQLHCAMYDAERISYIIVQRAREITGADECALLLPDNTMVSTSWITPALHEKLRVLCQREGQASPLIIERSGASFAEDFLIDLPLHIKTLFAIPLLVGETALHGIVIGAFHRAWKLRREEIVLLRVLANQASAALENIHLMTEVIEARNEARKLLRRALDDQRLKELILESVPGGLLTVDLNGRITTFNRAAATMLGYHSYEALGQPLQNILRLPVPLEKMLESRRGFPASLESQVVVTVDAAEHELALDVSVVPLLDEPGQRVGLLAAFTDITAIQRLEEEKRRLDRLATLGEMAANVAHEVRNPLASIKTSVHMLRDDLASSAPNLASVQESLVIVQHEVERLDATVRDLLQFARPRQLHRVPSDLVALSEYVLRVIQPQCTEASVVVHRVYHDLPLTLVDVGQMEQVLLNLYTNALQAMPDGGILTVACQVAQEAAATPTPGETSERSGGSIEIVVNDTGSGIAPDHLGRIFQPFFTTKAHGSGLGLPITRRLVEDHGGQLRVESHLGYGSTFTVHLPLVNADS